METSSLSRASFPRRARAAAACPPWPCSQAQTVSVAAELPKPRDLAPLRRLNAICEW
jgi:hypothetical protein